jgi:peptidyl-prolyl cis-trans isomerase SurA
MLKKLFFIMVVFMLIFMVSCSPKQSEIIVAEYGDYNVKMDEFEKAYAKNIGGIEKAKVDSLENYKKFLELYVNFKMKLRNAEVRQINKNQDIANELNEYEKTIGASYLIEKELYEKGLQDLYDKRAFELRVSHLLIRTDSISQEEGNKKALAIIDSVKNGASFDLMVLKHTDDQFHKTNGGDIYYFTAGMIMPEFEDLAYSTPVGEIAETPLKTQYGFHILKVTEKIKRTPQVQASHILIRKEENTPGDGKEQKEKIAKILLRAKAGEDFAKLASEFSEDPGSKQKGGDLGFFSRRQMVQPFDEAVFNLEVGEISDIVESQFGYHIIKLTNKTEYPKFEEEEKSLRELYEKTRKQSEYEKLLKKYSDEVKLVNENISFEDLVKKEEPTKINKEYWESSLHKNQGNTLLFSISNNDYSVDSLFSFGIKDSKSSGKPALASTLNVLKDEFKNKKVLEAKALQLVENDDYFAELMNEYKNGIMIFKLQEDEVWNKMKMDSSAIYDLYEKTKNNYMFPNRVQYDELFTKSDSLARVYHSMLKAGTDFDSLVIKFNEQSKSKSIGKNELIDAKTNALSETAYKLANENDISEVIKYNNGWSIVKLIKKEPSRIKNFDEARAEVTSAYQDIESAQLEKSYVNSLNSIYNPKLFYEELQNAYKN